jgi:type II secretory pathway pseudopilin PulG
MTTLRRRVARDDGESLIELTIALLVLSVAAVAIVTAMTLSVKVSDIHRKQATASAAVRDYAEAIETAVAGVGYVPGTGAYPAYTAPTGYTASLTSKECWFGSAWLACAPGNDIGVQRLTLQVASSDGRATEKLVVIVRKPCGPGPTTCT